MLRRTIVVLAMLAAVPAVASAQPCGPPPSGPVAVTASSTLCFEPSADHDVLNLAGVPKVASYAWGHYLPGAAAPVQEWNLGKPAPANGAIRVKPAELVSVALEVLYEARVVAIGPDGLRGVSAPSNPFYRSGAPAAPRAPVWIPAL